jgi:DNA-binding MurR/RpiR family transcriptional regulator
VGADPTRGFQLADALLPLTGDDVVLVFVPGRHNRDVEAILTHAERTGAEVILVTSSLDRRLGDRVLVTLPAPMSDTKVTGEITTASMITDILVTAVAGRSVDRSTVTADLLTQLRADLDEEPSRGGRAR